MHAYKFAVGGAAGRRAARGGGAARRRGGGGARLLQRLRYCGRARTPINIMSLSTISCLLVAPWPAYQFLLLLPLASVAAAAAQQQQQQQQMIISNVEPRRTTKGDILNAHDGALYEVEGKYYLVGTSYFQCEGFTNCSAHIGDCGWQDNNFSLYSSPNLVDWDLENGNLLPNRTGGGGNFRPKLLYNKKNMEWILWYNYQPPTPNIPGYYNVATSQTIAGPYSIVKDNVPVSHKLNGDFNLFVDQDDVAYIVYNSDENGHLCGACHIPPCDCGFQMSVEKLSADCAYTVPFVHRD
jgi:hypothetical protein